MHPLCIRQYMVFVSLGGTGPHASLGLLLFLAVTHVTGVTALFHAGLRRDGSNVTDGTGVTPMRWPHGPSPVFLQQAIAKQKRGGLAAQHCRDVLTSASLASAGGSALSTEAGGWAKGQEACPRIPHCSARAEKSPLFDFSNGKSKTRETHHPCGFAGRFDFFDLLIL